MLQDDEVQDITGNENTRSIQWSIDYELLLLSDRVCPKRIAHFSSHESGKYEQSLDRKINTFSL